MIGATRRGAGAGWGGLTIGFWKFSLVNMVTLERQDIVPTLERGNDQKKPVGAYLVIEVRLGDVIKEPSPPKPSAIVSLRSSFMP